MGGQVVTKIGAYRQNGKEGHDKIGLYIQTAAECVDVNVSGHGYIDSLSCLVAAVKIEVERSSSLHTFYFLILCDR